MREPQVGLVRPETVEGIGPGHLDDGGRSLPRRRLGRIEDGLGHVGHDIVLAGERGLHVQLGELELAVGPQVLVAQAAGDLVVAVEAADHEELLGQLGALGQRVEGTVVQAAGHRELAGALGGGGPQQRGLDLAEPLAVHGGTDGGVDPRPQAQVPLQARAAQVDVAVAQADLLVGLVPLVDRERRRLGLVEDDHGAVAHLDLSGRDPRVLHARRAGGAPCPRWR